MSRTTGKAASWGRDDYAPNSGLEAEQMLQALIPYFFAACGAFALAGLAADLRRLSTIGGAIARRAIREL